jgi:zinc transport system substrate-binding protein
VQADNGKPNVVTTIFTPFDFTRAITGGDDASKYINLRMLLPPGSESHSYEPTPQDIISVQNSDIFIYVGGESDVWVDRILSSMDTSNKIIIKLMECVSVVEEEIVEGMQDDEHDHEHEHEEGDHKEVVSTGSTTGGEAVVEPVETTTETEYDEHVWTSPYNAALIVNVITNALCEKDSANAAYYKANSEGYIAKLNQLDAAFKEVVQNGKRKVIVFGDRFPFRYFADHYGLEYYAAFPGCSTETEPSAATVAFLIDKIKAEQIPVVFHIELSNERMCQTISEATGAKILLMHACHNVSKKDFEGGASYLELTTRNVDTLREGLN